MPSPATQGLQIDKRLAPAVMATKNIVTSQMSDATLSQCDPYIHNENAGEKQKFHVCIVSGFAESLINFRGDLIDDLITYGHKVTALAPSANEAQADRIRAFGADFISYEVKRNGVTVSSDLKTLTQLVTIFDDLQPDIVIAYTIKPVIWSGIALLHNKSARYFALITGLGYAFHGSTIKRRLLRSLVCWLYRFSITRAEIVFFQNPDNQQTFVSEKILGGKPSIVLPGSGIHLDRFPLVCIPSGELVFLMIARLLGEKGVREFVAAATRHRELGSQAKFRLVGPYDPSPDGITSAEVEAWKKQGAVTIVGPLDDVRSELADCHVYVLPSYHEGLPRTVLEAMSTGRPIITTNAPGCKETVENGRNGFLVEPRSSKELVERIQWFLDNRDAIEPMGRESRKIAEERFSVDRVNRTIFGCLLAPRTPQRGSFLTRLLGSVVRPFAWLSRRCAS
jgi:glycosyltransferase involved in cell wall biosynthesis